MTVCAHQDHTENLSHTKQPKPQPLPPLGQVAGCLGGGGLRAIVTVCAHQDHTENLSHTTLPKPQPLPPLGQVAGWLDGFARTGYFAWTGYLG